MIKFRDIKVSDKEAKSVGGGMKIIILGIPPLNINIHIVPKYKS
jgi:hypothetical protein